MGAESSAALVDDTPDSSHYYNPALVVMDDVPVIGNDVPDHGSQVTAEPNHNHALIADDVPEYGANPSDNDGYIAVDSSDAHGGNAQPGDPWFALFEAFSDS